MNSLFFVLISLSNLNIISSNLKHDLLFQYSSNIKDDEKSINYFVDILYNFYHLNEEKQKKIFQKLYNKKSESTNSLIKKENSVNNFSINFYQYSSKIEDDEKTINYFVDGLFTFENLKEEEKKKILEEFNKKDIESSNSLIKEKNNLDNSTQLKVETKKKLTFSNLFDFFKKKKELSNSPSLETKVQLSNSKSLFQNLATKIVNKQTISISFVKILNKNLNDLNQLVSADQENNIPDYQKELIKSLTEIFILLEPKKTGFSIFNPSTLITKNLNFFSGDSNFYKSITEKGNNFIDKILEIIVSHVEIIKNILPDENFNKILHSTSDKLETLDISKIFDYLLNNIYGNEKSDEIEAKRKTIKEYSEKIKTLLMENKNTIIDNAVSVIDKKVQQIEADPTVWNIEAIIKFLSTETNMLIPCLSQKILTILNDKTSLTQDQIMLKEIMEIIIKSHPIEEKAIKTHVSNLLVNINQEAIEEAIKNFKFMENFDILYDNLMKIIMNLLPKNFAISGIEPLIKGSLLTFVKQEHIQSIIKKTSNTLSEPIQKTMESIGVIVTTKIQNHIAQNPQDFESAINENLVSLIGYLTKQWKENFANTIGSIPFINDLIAENHEAITDFVNGTFADFFQKNSKNIDTFINSITNDMANVDKISEYSNIIKKIIEPFKNKDSNYYNFITENFLNPIVVSAKNHQSQKDYNKKTFNEMVDWIGDKIANKGIISVIIVKEDKMIKEYIKNILFNIIDNKLEVYQKEVSNLIDKTNFDESIKTKIKNKITDLKTMLQENKNSYYKMLDDLVLKPIVNKCNNKNPNVKRKDYAIFFIGPSGIFLFIFMGYNQSKKLSQSQINQEKRISTFLQSIHNNINDINKTAAPAAA